MAAQGNIKGQGNQSASHGQRGSSCKGMPWDAPLAVAVSTAELDCSPLTLGVQSVRLHQKVLQV